MLKNEGIQIENIREELLKFIETDQHIKKDVIGRIPDNIVDEMRDHLEDIKERNKNYSNTERRANKYYEDTHPDAEMIAGRMFELLNYYQYENDLISEVKKGELSQEVAENMLYISNTLCNILRDPGEYNIPSEFGDRVPDSVYIGIKKDGSYVIYALGEAKLGELDNRALSQLKSSGSRQTLTRVIENINEQMENTSESELKPEVKRIKEILGGKKLQHSKNLQMHLLVPTRDDDLFGANVTFRSNELVHEFKGLEERDNVIAQNSPFSAKEVFLMSEYIHRKIVESEIN
jgi:phage gpG-like protein